MKKVRLLTMAFAILGTSLNAQTHICAGGSVTAAPEAVGSDCSKSSASYINHYRLQQSYVPNIATAEKTIKVAFHIWRDGNGGGNFQNTSADINFLNSIVTSLTSGINTQYLDANDAPSDPLPGVLFIGDTKIRVSLESIYFYDNTALHGKLGQKHAEMNSTARSQNPECIEYLNIHFSGSPTNFALQSVEGNNDYYIGLSAGGDGLGVGNGDANVLAQQITHELGHALALCHTWAGSYCTESVSTSYLDLLTDVFAGPPYSLHQGGWSFDPTLPSNTATNNMMGSTYAASYFSPLQMGRMHRALSLEGVRKYATGYSTTPLEISSNEVWNFSTKLYKDLVVKNGATLTIKCLVRFVKEARVIVEPGGQLIIDGGHLTKSQFENWWGGIYVSGNTSQVQDETNQGKLVIINDGEISHARDAITNIGITPNGGWIWGTTGGIIHATEAKFTNNRRDVQLLGYLPVNAKNEKYDAYFTDCDFIRDDKFSIENMIQSITMNGVAGIEIRGCKFINHNNPDFAYKGGGIFTIGATYKVHENTSTSVGCEFEGYADAIRSLDDFSIAFPITVVGADFTNNIHGIYLDAVQNAKIAYNDISVKANHSYTPPVGTPFQSRAYGIYLNCSNLFLMHDNTLTNPDGNSIPSAGIVINTNSGAPDQLYNNTVSKFEHGSQAIGINRSGTDSYTGLTYKCNTMGYNGDYNSTDFIIDPNGSIAGFQISLNEIAANTFSSSSSTSHFENHGAFVIYHRAINSTDPVNHTGLAFYSNQSVLPATCNPLPKPSIVANPGTTGQDIANIEALIIQDRNLRAQLVDEGSTPQLEAEILFASNQTEYQNLYIEMMDMAPYVSQENLLNLISLTGFPELALRNIMVANPHSSRDGEVWDALVNREPSLSQQTLVDIENEQQTITAKDVLDMKIASEETESHYLSLQLIQFYTEGLGENSSYLQDLKDHLAYRNEVYFRYALIDLYLSEGDVTSASAALSNISNQCELSGYEDEEFIFMSQYYSTISPLIDNETRMDSLNNTTIDVFTEIAQNGVGMATGKARAILALNGASTEYHEPLLDNAAQYKSATESNYSDRSLKAETGFDLYPNPASDHVVLQWDWLKAGLTDGFDIYIRDMNGALIRKVNIDNHQVNTKMLRLNGLAPGIYLLSVESGNNVLHQAKLTIQK